MMTEKLSTVARPYALAAFEYALDHAELTNWDAMLKTAADIVQNSTIAPLLNNPQVTQQQLVQIFKDVMGKSLDTHKNNFLELLGEYERLEALPVIAALFAEYQAQHEKTMDVTVTSAIPMSDAQKKKFADALTRRLQNKVELRYLVDESILGGAIVRAGDQVIDGSIRGKLNRMLEETI